ncbi:MAG: DNA polymerase III subunit delta [Clostridiales bacterium]|nr:DNA polymerase III subunit delta [Candidatus Crickella caballi]
MAYIDFVNDFKKELCKDVLFLYGAEDYLIDWALYMVIARYVDDDSRNVDVQYIDGSTCSAADIMGAARAYSMFSDRRVIVVQNYLSLYHKRVDPNDDALLEICGNGLDSSVVVFTLDSKYSSDINAYARKLIKAASAYEFARLDKADLQGFINKRVHKAGKLLGHREMNHLIDLSGYYFKESDYSLAKLDRDLEKITGACEGDRITVELIEDLLVGEKDKYVFNLVDALMAGDKGKAMEVAETVIREEDGAMPVLALLTKQFEIMYDSLELSRRGMTVSEMAKHTGVNEFRFKKAFQSARSFNSDKLKEILINAYNIDRDIKTGNIDKDVAFELLIVGV